MPRTRGEDAAFRAEVLAGQVHWRPIHDKCDDDGELVDRFSIREPEVTSAEGYRLIWYHSTRKAELDAAARRQRIERALERLAELREKLASPRTRYRERAKVAEAVEAILERDRDVEGWIAVTIEETDRGDVSARSGAGGPKPRRRYVKSEETRFELTLPGRLRPAGRGGAVRRDLPADHATSATLSERELLLAYKQQPAIEKRFAQLKTDFVVAPVYLKEVSRIQALLCVYFFVLLVESLLERELRRAMEREGDREPAAVPGGSGVPSADGSAGDRPVRGRAAARVVSGRRTAGGLHHGVEPAATSNPAAAGDDEGLRHLT